MGIAATPSLRLNSLPAGDFVFSSLACFLSTSMSLFALVLVVFAFVLSTRVRDESTDERDGIVSFMMLIRV